MHNLSNFIHPHQDLYIRPGLKSVAVFPDTRAQQQAYFTTFKIKCQHTLSYILILTVIPGELRTVWS